MKIFNKEFKNVSVIRTVVICSTLAIFQLSYGAESPVQSTLKNVAGGPIVKDVRGEIIPLIWRARVGNAVSSIPLSSIDHYGVQDYFLEGVAKIREFTVTTKSQSMVRIYHFQPLGSIQESAAKHLKNLQNKLNGSDGDDNDLPIKDYPTTTHKKMVEYRVSDKGDINTLFESLDQAMETYLGRELVPSQRPSIVSEVVVKTK